MDMKPYGVYVKVDAENCITAINSDAFMPSTDGWVRIDEGWGDRYHHAQGNYMPQPLYDNRNICRYKLVDGAVVERTAEEMDADYVPPAIKPTAEERITELEDQNETLLQCILEMSEIVYA